VQLSEHINTKYDRIECPCCGEGLLKVQNSGVFALFESLYSECKRKYPGRFKGLKVASGFRCWNHHLDIYKGLYVGDYPNTWRDFVPQHSAHLEGLALDLHPIGITVKELRAVAKSLHSEFGPLNGGLGGYSWGVHIDAGRFRSWGIL